MNNKENNQNEDIKQSELVSSKNKNTGNFLHFTGQKIIHSINNLENIISTDHLALAPYQKDPSLGKPSTAFYRKRLNSTDTIMLENSAYKALDNEEFILEKRIENLETELVNVIEKLEVAKVIKNDDEFAELNNQKQTLENNIKNLKNTYESKNIETKITLFLVKIFTTPKNIKNRIKVFVKNCIRKSKILKKIKPLFRAFLIRDTIEQLNQINNSIDELVKMKVPFGENESRYATLVNHLSKASSIHTQVKKELKS